LPALILLLLNVAGFLTYRALYAGKAQTRRSEVERARTQHVKLVERRERAQALASQAEQNERRLVGMYTDYFQTQEQRITKVIAEVKDLAEKAGLDPPGIRYPDEPIESFGLVKRSIVFNVEGTYGALRRFVNFLELTDSFVILEEIRPGDQGSGSGSRLSIALKVATFFLDDEIDPQALARSRETVGSER
jgi:Tfp pilus assembly protein PilO